MSKVELVATGAHLPGDPITNEELEQYLGPVPEDILEGLQVKTRHWIADPATGEHRESNSGMATKASRQALERAGIEPDEIDLIVLSTASPDYLLPPEVTFVQENLGLSSCATMEIRSGCAGAVEALDVARLYLERGLHKTALVVGSEAISPLLVPLYREKGPRGVRMRERLGAYSFGDGAGAMVLRATADGEGRGVLGSAIACTGGDRKPGMQIFGAGGTHAPLHEQLKAKRLLDLRVDVVESGRYTPYVLTDALRETLAASGIPADEIDMCVIPEGNASYMTDELREAGLLTPEWTTLEPRIFENLSDVGATGSAAVPLALDYAWTSGRLAPGEVVMLLAIETSKWKYAGWVFDWSAAAPAPAEAQAAPAARAAS